MKGGDNGASFAANTQIIQDYQTFYNLGAFSNGIGGCTFNGASSSCYGGGFKYVTANSVGDVGVGGSSSEYCYVHNDESSRCGK